MRVVDLTTYMMIISLKHSADDTSSIIVSTPDIASKMEYFWAEVVTLLTVWKLLTLDNPSSNPVMDLFMKPLFTVNCGSQRRKVK